MGKTIEIFERIYGGKDQKIKNNLISGDVEHPNVEELGNSIFGGGSPHLRKLIANMYGCEENMVYPVEGGTSFANFLVFYSLLNKGDNVLVEDPCYEPLLKVPNFFCKDIKRFKRNNFERSFKPRIESIVDQVTANTKLIVLSNPHNPTGKVLDENFLTTLLEAVEPDGTYVLADEIYGDPFIDKDASVARLGKNGITTYGLTKRYGLSTLRFGLVIAPEEVVDKVRNAHFTTSAVSSGLLEKHWIKFFEKDIFELKKRGDGIINTNLDNLEDMIKRREDIVWSKPDSGSVCCIGIKDVDTEDFVKYLSDKGIGVGYGGYTNIKDFIRIGLGSNPEKFKKSLIVFENALDKYKQ